MDHELSMKQHVIKVAGACFHQLRHLRQIRRHVGLEVTTRLILALVISRLDYCNSVLAGLPASTVNILQRVQNAAARLICQLKPREHVTTSLQQLHWLPVKRVQHKPCTIMYAVHYGRLIAPSCITELMTSVAAQTSRPRLRSADTIRSIYVQPRIRTKFGERAFSHASPAAWNSLPDELRQTPTLNNFKRNLKSHLFSTAFSYLYYFFYKTHSCNALF